MKITSRSGFSLVEVTFAIGLMSFCVLSLLGLLSVGLQSDATSSSETAVTNIVTAVVSDLSATPQTSPPSDQVSPQFGIPMKATETKTYTLFFKDDGTLAGAVDTNALSSSLPAYRATVTVIPPALASSKSATVVRVLLTWPALADGKASDLPSKQKGSVETVTAFLRN